jgi:hypothetical protein
MTVPFTFRLSRVEDNTPLSSYEFILFDALSWRDWDFYWDVVIGATNQNSLG